MPAEPGPNDTPDEPAPAVDLQPTRVGPYIDYEWLTAQSVNFLDAALADQLC